MISLFNAKIILGISDFKIVSFEKWKKLMDFHGCSLSTVFIHQVFAELEKIISFSNVISCGGSGDETILDIFSKLNFFNIYISIAISKRDSCFFSFFSVIKNLYSKDCFH